MPGGLLPRISEHVSETATRKEPQEMDDSRLTFGQRHGYSSIPSKLRLKEISPEVRVSIWNVLCRHVPIHSDITAVAHRLRESVWTGILLDVYESLYRGRIDSFDLRAMWHRMDQIVEKGYHWQIFDLVQEILRHPSCPSDFQEAMASCFDESQLAYSISFSNVPTIMPMTNEQTSRAIKNALDEMKKSKIVGGIRHLEKASDRINEGDHAGAVRESIHAVESVARTLDPKSSNTLAPALKALEKRRGLHPALKGAMNKLYGYTSDEQGVRHALLEKGEADVGSEEAVFMFGACAVFCGYLASKGAESKSE